MSPTPVAGVQGTSGTSLLSMNDGVSAAGTGTDGSAFGASLAGALDNVQSLQSQANTLAVQAVTGDFNDIHNATIAATRAAVTMELVSAVRNKGVDAFNEIMRMQA